MAEYFAEGENAGFFAPAIEDSDRLVVLVICIYEVFKKVLQNQGQAMVEFRVADLVKGTVVDLTTSLAMSAGLLSVELKLPMADSIILAITREHQATLWTQDDHFKDLPGVIHQKDIRFKLNQTRTRGGRIVRCNHNPTLPDHLMNPFDGPISEIIRGRFSCRRYLDAPLDESKRKQIQRFIDSLPAGLPGSEERRRRGSRLLIGSGVVIILSIGSFTECFLYEQP